MVFSWSRPCCLEWWRSLISQFIQQWHLKIYIYKIQLNNQLPGYLSACSQACSQSLVSTFLPFEELNAQDSHKVIAFLWLHHAILLDGYFHHSLTALPTKLYTVYTTLYYPILPYYSSLRISAMSVYKCSFRLRTCLCMSTACISVATTTIYSFQICCSHVYVLKFCLNQRIPD